MASEEQLQVDLADRITKLDQLRREQRTYGQARKAIKELVTKFNTYELVKLVSPHNCFLSPAANLFC